MVAVAQLIPTDPEEKESVLSVLHEHPGLREFIQKAVNKANEIFPEFSVSLDTVGYDEWDPPVTLTLSVVQPLNEFARAYDRYVQWVVHEPDYNRELVHVFPVWRGPLEAAS